MPVTGYAFRSRNDKVDGIIVDEASWKDGIWDEDGGVNLLLRFKKLAFQGFSCILRDAYSIAKKIAY